MGEFILIQVQGSRTRGDININEMKGSQTREMKVTIFVIT